ncbi:hypothetical protein CW751_13550 [Brumimicrobium salinarum]|uniref:Uncharacterized protein n=1 Tax=Brumimicrobium salinarum TaxID=2058658 RepID=A0A2I0QZH8_9FLAO|nr:hypothetical protein [Brumimicrobium salinarum]PKR79745.1 hypothetical protein CW751_13550 [Brumimicrobium salinarum]
MKILILLLSIVFIFYSCTNNNVAEDSDGNKVTTTYTKKVNLPVNPCDYISRETVTSYFDVKSTDLELNEDFTDPHSKYAKCGFKWKKNNFEELSKVHQDAMMSYMMKSAKKDQGPKPKLSDITKLESPYAKLMVGEFKAYEDFQKAVKRFDLLHKVPSKNDIEALNKSIDEELDKQDLKAETKKQGKSVVGGIAESLKFTKVEGVGDRAYYDHLDRALNVRFGIYTFSVGIDSDLSFDENIEIAKKVALNVWNNL